MIWSEVHPLHDRRGLLPISPSITGPVAGPSTFFDFRHTFATASVHSGTKSTPGTSFPRNDGRNSQCHPSSRLIAPAMPRSSTSSAGDAAPSMNKGKIATCTRSAIPASANAIRILGCEEIVMCLSLIEIESSLPSIILLSDCRVERSNPNVTVLSSKITPLPRSASCLLNPKKP